MNTRQIEKLYEQYLIPVYNRLGIAAARGSGSWLWDAEERKYLDFFPGWGTNALGHCHPHLIKAVHAQMKRLIHVPNTFYHEPQGRLARELVRASFEGKAFFSNSGAESVEAAIKLVRRYGHLHPGPSGSARWEMITMENSFHGRTLGAMAATGQAKHQKGFEPVPEGFKHVPFNRIAAVEQAIGPNTVAVMIEPIQGEGGIHVATPEFAQGLRRLCDERDLLLIFDEISTGMGRTGTLFCFQQYGVIPDILLLAKPVAGGLPMGALIAKKSISDIWEKASHATTFGGNPLLMAAGLAALEVIRKEKLPQNALRQGRYLTKRLELLKKKYSMIKEIRGRGLMIGVELDRPGRPVVMEAAKRRLLINCTQEKVLRMYPALTVTRKEVDQAIERLEQAFATVQSVR